MASKPRMPMTPSAPDISRLLQQLSLQMEKDPGLPLAWLEGHRQDPNLMAALKGASADVPVAAVLTCYELILRQDLIAAGHAIEKHRRPDDPLQVNILLDGLFFAACRDFIRASQLLVSVVNRHKGSLFIWQKMLTLCLNAGYYSQGIDWYQKAIALSGWGAAARFNLMELGSALYALDYQFERAIAIRREELALQMQRPPASPAAKSSDFNVAKTWQALTAVVDLLEGHGMRPFPTAGTLLGWWREGAILNNDKDLDVALMPADSLDLARKIMLAQVRYIAAPMSLNSNSYSCFFDRVTQVTVDLLQFWDAGEKLGYGWLLPGKYRAQSRVLHFDRFDLLRDHWQGHEFWRPDDPDHFLTQMYGPWRAPDPHFDSCAGVPNLQAMTEMVQATVYNQLVSCVSRGNYAKAMALIVSLRDHNDDHPVLGRMEIWLRKNLQNQC